MSKKAVIVGAGYAGVAAAIYLNKKGKKDDLEITLIDRNDYHTLLTELHEVAGNRMMAYRSEKVQNFPERYFP